MPHFLAYRFGTNPLAVTQSEIPILSLKNYLVAVDSPGSMENERVYAYLTELTSMTVMGENAAEDFGVSDGEELEIKLISDVDNHQYAIKTKVHVGSINPADYISLGWDVIEEEFEIEPENAHGILHLDAHDMDRCEPLP